MSIKFSLIIPTVKQTTMLADCVRSIREYEPDRSRYEIIVVDDGSDASVQEWIKAWGKREGVTVILRPVNKGFAHTVNVGLAAAAGDYLVLVNNDVLFLKPFLSPLESAFLADPKIGVVGAKLLYPNNQVQHAGVVRRPKSPDFLHIHKHADRYDPAVCRSRYYISVTGALFTISRTTYERVGKFNELYFLACEDSEYCLRVWANGLRVFYNHEVEAQHQEGGTRGNNDKIKLKKGPQWFLKERETIARFCHDFKFYDPENYELHVANLNQALDLLVDPPAPTLNPEDVPNLPLIKASGGEIKLEIGCGYNPQPGYLHLDVRALPDVEYICDFSRERLPFDDGTLAEILSNHSIEHISWRDLPFVVGEWFRVLKPGGRVLLRTPDLEFIAKTYLAGKTTPEWPGDEAFMRENIVDEITPGWWANIKLFAGQDYPSNFHFLCFDLAMLQGFFSRVGFDRIARVKLKEEFSPGELQAEAYKPLSIAAPAPGRKRRLLVKRRGALGDVLMTTPILRRLDMTGEFDEIDFATDSPEVYRGSGLVSNVIRTPGPKELEAYDHVIDLDLAYERRPKMHVIDAYSEVAFGSSDYPFDRSTELAISDADRAAALAVFTDNQVDPEKCVVLHAAVTWKNRTWPAEFWESVASLLRMNGHHVIQVGRGGDVRLTGGKPIGSFKFIDLFGRLTIQQTAALITHAKCFVGNDSALIHIAGTTQTPIVGLFTSARPEFRMPYREGRLGWAFTALTPKIDCAGCLHNETPPVVYCDCRRGDFKCLGLITPLMVLHAVKEYR